MVENFVKAYMELIAVKKDVIKINVKDGDYDKSKVINVFLDSSDMGRAIGKGGNNAKAFKKYHFRFQSKRWFFL